MSSACIGGCVFLGSFRAGGGVSQAVDSRPSRTPWSRRLCTVVAGGPPDLATRVLLLILLCLLKLAAQLAHLVASSHATPARAWTRTHARTHHQAGGRTQLCSLKGKVNSCARDSWSSHDIPSPNISHGCGRQGASAREGSIYNLDGALRLQPPRPRCSFFFPSTTNPLLPFCGDNMRGNDFLLLYPI